jgi:hypothetical protein
MSAQKPSRLHLLNEFESAPHSALFNQQTIAAVLIIIIRTLHNESGMREAQVTSFNKNTGEVIIEPNFKPKV